MTYMNLLLDIAEARKRGGLSQEQLALRLGVPRLKITRLEAGVGSVDTLTHVMSALDFRVSGVARGPDLPTQIRARRERLKWSIDKMSAKTGLDSRTILAVERGEGTVISLLSILRVIAPDAKRSEPPRASWAYDPANMERDQRFTPKWFLSHIVESFGSIDLDPCAHELASVESRRKILLPECGLDASWQGAGLTFINPPFSAVTRWMSRAAEAWDRKEVSAIAMLVPARTDSEVYQQIVSRDADTLFLGGRMRFESAKGLAWPAPFSLMLILWGMSEEQIARFIGRAPSVRMRPWRGGRDVA